MARQKHKAYALRHSISVCTIRYSNVQYNQESPFMSDHISKESPRQTPSVFILVPTNLNHYHKTLHSLNVRSLCVFFACTVSGLATRYV